ncbi:MAG: gliding motility-associated C-terminal domain-containing protein [Bacteroidales bacterium]|nr:gliding motility-associated C-terminal domain-containing protein [Bacteroidales bacterium]
MNKNVFFILIFHFLLLFLKSQCYWVNNGANVIISNNSKVIVLGEYQNLNNGYTTLENNFDSLYVKQMLNDATLNSNGAIFVDTGNWINNNTFNANNSRTYLRGINQEIKGNSPTTFYDLYLYGPQTNGQKKLGNFVVVQNKLFLDANEVYLQDYTLTISNPATNALEYTSGYISSNDNGSFIRATNSTQSYYFPMGSENLPFRFRPINIIPSSTTNNLVGVNFRNYNATNYGYDPSIKENVLCEVNDQFFYSIERTSNSSNFDVEVFYNEVEDGVWETMAKWSTTPSPTEWKEQTPSSYVAGNPFSTVTATIQGSTSSNENIITLATKGVVVNLGNDTSICEGTSLTLDAGNPGYQYNWSTGSSNQQIQVSTAGTYSVTVTNPFNNCSNSDQIVIQVVNLPNAQITSNLLSFCQNDPNPTLQATPAGGVWSGQGIDPNSGTINLSSLAPGQYIIRYTATNACGSDKDSTQITVKEVPAIQVYGDPETCIGANDGKAWVTIQGNDVPYAIVWSNNQTTDTISMLVPGTYHVQVTGANGCKTSANTTVTAGTEECYITHIFIPNIFSPNGDGNNDVFQIYGAGIKNIKVYIYDRWGIKVYESSSLTDTWDGTYKGKPLDPAVFMYYITVEFKNGETKEFEGTLTLTR